MTLRLIPDDDDRMSANPEEPRADINAPRLRARPPGQATRWEFREVAGAPAAHEAGPIGGAKRCAPYPLGCGEEVTVLHAIGDDPRRRVCGACQGRANRERVGWAQTADAAPSPRGPR